MTTTMLKWKFEEVRGWLQKTSNDFRYFNPYRLDYSSFLQQKISTNFYKNISRVFSKKKLWDVFCGQLFSKACGGFKRVSFSSDVGQLTVFYDMR